MKKKIIIVLTIILFIGIIICIWTQKNSLTMVDVYSKMDKIKTIIVNEMNVEQEQIEINENNK